MRRIGESVASGVAQAWQRVAAASGRAWRRVRGDAWLLVQRAAAATIAWWLARWIGDHPDPFFAPIAAVVALNASLGERGLNALRLVFGVILGIVAGEITLLVLEGGYGSLAVSTFTAMAAARAFGGPPIVVVQAAAAAILTVAVADGQSGFNRLADALIGAAVALVFSQLLFTPEPLRLLHRAESAALIGLAEGLRLTARALASGDRETADQAMQQLRDVRDRLAVLGKTRAASGRVVRHSVAWRARLRPVVREQENAGHLDLLGVSCLMLTRTALAADPADGRALGRTVGEVAELLGELARSPGDTSVRQSVVDRLPAVLGDVGDFERAPGSPMATALAALRIVSADLMVFAGVEPADGAEATREGTASLRVLRAPRAARIPFLARFMHRR